MKISRKDARIIQVDDAVAIENLFDGKDFAFDVVIGKINGHHPKLINHVGDRAYFVLKGELNIHAGDDTHHVVSHDLVIVPANTPHGLDGDGEYLIITAPPLKPENEKVLEQAKF